MGSGVRCQHQFRLGGDIADIAVVADDRRLLGTLPSMEHVIAQEEVKSLLRQLKLPIDERGRRRAANRAEWFNQVNKPLEVHDIFGAPQIGFQTGDRLRPMFD